MLFILPIVAKSSHMSYRLVLYDRPPINTYGALSMHEAKHYTRYAKRANHKKTSILLQKCEITD